MPTVFDEVAQLKGVIAGLETQLATHKESSALLADASALVKTLTEKNEKLASDHASAISALNLSVTDLTARAEKAEAELKTEKESVEKKAALRAQEILAGTGAPNPIDAKATPNPATAKKDFSQLKGLAKSIAIHTAENSN